MRVSHLVCCTIVLLLLGHKSAAQQTIPDTRLTIEIHESPLNVGLTAISSKSGLYFAYKSSLIDTVFVSSFIAENLPLQTLLDSLLTSRGLTYEFKNRQMFLRKKPDSYRLIGCILDAADSVPIPYASLSLKGKPLGTITDFKGIFEWELSNQHLKDTIMVSSMGYEHKTFTMEQMIERSRSGIYLKTRHFEIEPVIVSGNDFHNKTLGNKGKRESGSIYIDTHGQQTGLHIENKIAQTGKLLSVSFYLSDEGNTNAPFRLRIYALDSLTLKPKHDIIDEILVVKPTDVAGWYTIDLMEYNLNFPMEGLFVALEGIFPNDYEYYAGSEEFIDIGRLSPDQSIGNEQPVTISYGQRLGYNRHMAENTWHFSLSHTWFQLRKQQYGVMIQAEVRFGKENRSFFHRKKSGKNEE